MKKKFIRIDDQGFFTEVSVEESPHNLVTNEKLNPMFINGAGERCFATSWSYRVGESLPVIEDFTIMYQTLEEWETERILEKNNGKV
jgi:hypothetical protein